MFTKKEKLMTKKELAIKTLMQYAVRTQNPEDVEKFLICIYALGFSIEDIEKIREMSNEGSMQTAQEMLVDYRKAEQEFLLKEMFSKNSSEEMN